MPIIRYGNHVIECKTGMSLTGKEVILYDGREVSKRHSMSGATHVFSTREDDEEVTYEVEVGTAAWGFRSYTTVRRNGVVIYSNK